MLILKLLNNINIQYRNMSQPPHTPSYAGSKHRPSFASVSHSPLICPTCGLQKQPNSIIAPISSHPKQFSNHIPLKTDVKTETILYYPIIDTRVQSQSNTHNLQTSNSHQDRVWNNYETQDNRRIYALQQPIIQEISKQTEKNLPKIVRKVQIPIKKVKKPYIRQKFETLLGHVQQQQMESTPCINNINNQNSHIRTPSFQKLEQFETRKFPASSTVRKYCQACRSRILLTQRDDFNKHEEYQIEIQCSKQKIRQKERNKGLMYIDCCEQETQREYDEIISQKMNQKYSQERLRNHRSFDRAPVINNEVSPTNYPKNNKFAQRSGVKDYQYYKNLTNQQINLELREAGKQKSNLSQISSQAQAERQSQVYGGNTGRSRIYSPVLDFPLRFEKSSEYAPEYENGTTRLKRIKSAELLMIEERIEELKRENKRLRDY